MKLGKHIQSTTVMGFVFILIVLSYFHVYAAEGTANVSSPDDFVAAVNDETVTTIHVQADMDLTDQGVLDVDGKMIDLGGNCISSNNFTLFFQGKNFTIKNGSMDSKGGSYALFVGDEGETDSVVIEDITAMGGFNIYNATNVTLRNVDVTGTQYYALWCDENAHVTIESGNFTSHGVAVLGMSITETDMLIKGGNYVANGLNLVLKGDYGKPVIAGGKFDKMPDKEYLADGFAPIDDGNGNFIVSCDHNDTEIKDAKDPTCSEEGYTGDVYCKNCHAILQNGTKIPATGHHFSTTWESDESRHWKVCECGAKAELGNHSFQWIINKKATADEKGLRHKECSVCGYRQNEEEYALDNVIDDINTKTDGESGSSKPKKDNDDSIIRNTSYDNIPIFYAFLLMLLGSEVFSIFYRRIKQ